MIKTTIPKDKSSSVYFEDSDKDLISTKPLLVFYQMTPDQISFRRAHYVHSRKMWIDWEGFQIYKDEFIGWTDVDKFLSKEEVNVLLRLVCNDAQEQTNRGKEVTEQMYNLRYKLRDLWIE